MISICSKFPPVENDIASADFRFTTREDWNGLETRVYAVKFEQAQNNMASLI